MQWKSMTMMACALVVVAIGRGQATADDRRTDADKGEQQCINALGTKLGLNDQQKQAVQRAHQECEKKAGPIEHQIWSQCNAEREAVKQQLNEQQQTQFTDALKSMRRQELDNVAQKLALSAEQKQRIATICDNFEPKFEQLAAAQEKGEKAHQQFRELRHEFIQAIRPELNPEQQAKLPFVMEEEHRRWRDPSVRRDHLKAVLDKLNLNAQQKEQINATTARYEKQLEPLFAELNQVRKEGREALDNQLTAEQREKLREIRRASGDQQ